MIITSLLTGKAKKDFLNEHGHKEHEIDELYLYALMIEWFDSVGFHINITASFIGLCVYYFVNIVWFSEDPLDICDEPNLFNSRKEAMESAIIKANKLYNSK